MKLTSTTAELAELISLAQQFTVKNMTVDVVADPANPQFHELIKSKFWPAAVNEAVIVTTDAGKDFRASSILASAIGPQKLKAGKFLDFGCGEGHCVQQAAKITTALGFDPQLDLFAESSGLTHEWQKVLQAAPFETVLCYDVLDHILDPADRQLAVQRIRQVLTPTGVAVIRFHPFTSRHGTHLYHQFNKAYAHLFMTPDELTALGYHTQPVAQITRPLRTYNELMATAKLHILHKDVAQRNVEPLFQEKHIVNQLIAKYWPDDDYVKSATTLTNILSVEFIDFKVRR